MNENQAIAKVQANREATDQGAKTFIKSGNKDSGIHSATHKVIGTIMFDRTKFDPEDFRIVGPKRNCNYQVRLSKLRKVQDIISSICQRLNRLGNRQLNVNQAAFPRIHRLHALIPSLAQRIHFAYFTIFPSDFKTQNSESLLVPVIPKHKYPT